MSTNKESVARGLITPESEQIVMAAYRKSTGKSLSRSDLYLFPDRDFSGNGVDLALSYSRERVKGRPLQYITGFQVFNDSEYKVRPGVLIPRQETELLLLEAIHQIAEKGNESKTGIEIGLGSGILSIELLKRFSHLCMIASELSPVARETALENAGSILGKRGLGNDRLYVVSPQRSQEIWEPIVELSTLLPADFIISNPPYLSQGDEVEFEVRVHEPHEALFAPLEDPLYFYRAILAGAATHLKNGGFVFLEMPHERAFEVEELFLKEGWKTKVIPDLTQRPRVLIAQRMENKKNG